MSNKWAESHGGQYEHNEHEYYSKLGVNPYYFESDEPDTDWFDGEEDEREDIEAYEHKVLLSTVVICIFIVIVSLL